MAAILSPADRQRVRTHRVLHAAIMRAIARCERNDLEKPYDLAIAISVDIDKVLRVTRKPGTDFEALHEAARARAPYDLHGKRHAQARADERSQELADFARGNGPRPLDATDKPQIHPWTDSDCKRLWEASARERQARADARMERDELETGGRG